MDCLIWETEAPNIEPRKAANQSWRTQELGNHSFLAVLIHGPTAWFLLPKVGSVHGKPRLQGLGHLPGQCHPDLLHQSKPLCLFLPFQPTNAKMWSPGEQTNKDTGLTPLLRSSGREITGAQLGARLPAPWPAGRWVGAGSLAPHLLSSLAGSHSGCPISRPMAQGHTCR